MVLNFTNLGILYASYFLFNIKIFSRKKDVFRDLLFKTSSKIIGTA